MTLETIVRKLEASERLTFDDAVALFRHPDVVAVGQLANRVRERLHGDRTYFNRNMRIEVTNVCVASCLFCSFAKLAEGAPGAHTMSLGEAWRELESRMDDPPAEIHIVAPPLKGCRGESTVWCVTLVRHATARKRPD